MDPFGYKIIRTNSEDYRGPWRVSTRSYFYTLFDHDGKEIASYQWDGGREPHLHVSGPFKNKHFETGRISIEQFVRTCITEFDVKTRQVDWRDILKQGQGTFEQHRTWPRQAQNLVRRRR